MKCRRVQRKGQRVNHWEPHPLQGAGANETTATNDLPEYGGGNVVRLSTARRLADDEGRLLTPDERAGLRRILAKEQKLDELLAAAEQLMTKCPTFRRTVDGL